ASRTSRSAVAKLRSMSSVELSWTAAARTNPLSLLIDRSVRRITAPNMDLPYRGTFGDPRPPSLGALRLPPGSMPPRQAPRPLKRRRYVGAYGPELMVCAASVRVGPARQAFWAVWDRNTRQLHEETRLGRGSVALSTGRLTVRAKHIQIDLELIEQPGVET